MLLRILQKDSTRLSWYLDFSQTEGFSAIREMVRGLTDLSTELDRVATTQGFSLSPMQVFGNDNHNGTITIVDNKIYEVILTCRREREKRPCLTACRGILHTEYAHNCRLSYFLNTYNLKSKDHYPHGEDFAKTRLTRSQVVFRQYDWRQKKWFKASRWYC